MAEASTIFPKLLKVQQAATAVKKNSSNPFFKSKYFDINELLRVVKPVLNENGLIITQQLTHIHNPGNEVAPALRTSITDVDSGERLSEIVPLPSYKNAQEMGSAITYVRRYALQAMLGLEAIDDDANLASGKTTPPPPRRKATMI